MRKSTSETVCTLCLQNPLPMLDTKFDRSMQYVIIFKKPQYANEFLALWPNLATSSRSSICRFQSFVYDVQLQIPGT